MINFFLVQNQQGQTRLSKWYIPCNEGEKRRVEQDIFRTLSNRGPKFTNFVEYNVKAQEHKLIYKRYAGLYFVFCVDTKANELFYLEAIHLFVVLLDKYFQNVCELDLVFRFNQVYGIIDEFILAGEIQEADQHEMITRIQEKERLG